MQRQQAAQIDFFWDIGSTNTYFAFHLLRPLAKRYDAEINYVPFNLGYVFRKHNYALTQEPRAKMKNRLDDLMRWAKRYDLPFNVPRQFPIKTSRVLRGSIVAEQAGLLEPYLDAVFSAYWERGDASIADYDGLTPVAASAGLDAASFAEAAESPDIKQQLIDATQSALDEGIFGAPTMRIESEIYWGKDRFEFIEDHLQRLA